MTFCETASQPGALPSSLWQVKTYFKKALVWEQEAQESKRENMYMIPLTTTASAIDQQEQGDAEQFPRDVTVVESNTPQWEQTKEAGIIPKVREGGIPLCHSMRTRCPPDQSDYIVYEALATEPKHIFEHAHPWAFKALADPDTMYLHEALWEPDHDKFVLTMEEEIQAH